MLSVRGKTPTLRLFLIIMFRCYFEKKIYVTLDVQHKMKYHGTKYQILGIWNWISRVTGWKVLTSVGQNAHLEETYS